MLRFDMNGLVVTLGLLVLSLTAAKGQPGPLDGFDLLAISTEGSLLTRVHCSETVNCSGRGEAVFWTFFGVSTPLVDTETRFTNTITLTDDEGEPFILSQLTFDPVNEIHDTFYSCQVQGDQDFSLTLNVTVLSEPLGIISEISNIDLSNKTIGDNTTVICQVETCVSTVMIYLYKDKDDLIDSSPFTDNVMNSVSAAFTLTVNENTAGRYTCRASALDVFASVLSFNITGTPQQPLTTVSSTTSSTTTSSTSSTIAPAPSLGMTATNQASSSSRPTPSMSPSSSPGGASAGQVVEWTLLLSLILVTVVSSLLVW